MDKTLKNENNANTKTTIMHCALCKFIFCHRTNCSCNFVIFDWRPRGMKRCSSGLSEAKKYHESSRTKNEERRIEKNILHLKRIFLVLEWALRKQSMPKSKWIGFFASHCYFIILVLVFCWCIVMNIVMGRLHFLLTAFYCYIVSSFLIRCLPCGIAFSIWLSFLFSYIDFEFVSQFQVCFHENSFVFVSVL